MDIQKISNLSSKKVEKITYVKPEAQNIKIDFFKKGINIVPDKNMALQCGSDGIAKNSMALQCGSDG